MGIEPTTYSLGSSTVLNPRNTLAAKQRISAVSVIKGLRQKSKTSNR